MDLTPLDTSRLLFGLSAAFHFLFVPLTLGLVALVALLEATALWTGKPAYREAARFWSWPFLLTFVCGVLTGYPLRHQLETHWSTFSTVVAPVFGQVFAFEGRVAPVMLALVILFAFGWRLLPLWHACVSALLAGVLVAQSTGILMLNAWMQLPVGLQIANGAAHVADLGELARNPLFLPKVLHTVAGAWVLGGMLVVSVSAGWLLARRHVDTARAALRVASGFTLVALLLTGAAGHWSGERLVDHQPMKFAAIEALWDTEDGEPPDLLLLAWPDMATRSNRVALGWDGGLGTIVGGEPTFRGLRELGQRLEDEGVHPSLPDVPLVFWSFRVMLACWLVLLVLVLVACTREPDAEVPGTRRWLRAIHLAWPLPWIATEAGWIVNEAGRQPWAITGVLTTKASLGAVRPAQLADQVQLAVPLAAMILAVSVVGVVRHVRRGPVADPPKVAPAAVAGPEPISPREPA